MSYIGQGLPADTFQGFVTDSFTGDGSATTFTLSKEPFSEDTLIVVINNVIQKPTTNFTVSGTTLTIVGTAVASGDVIYAIHMGGPLPIGGAAELDLNGASDKLILDTDGDTTISADTDDQIDFKAGGTDIMSLTATTATFNDGVTISVADNSDNLTLTSTDADANAGPNLRLYRNSGSPADHDIVGQIDFEGRNDNAEDIVYAKIFGSPKDVSDGTEDGGFFLHTMLAGSDVSRMGMSSSQTVFNDDSKDIDFRVETDSQTHGLFVDAGNNMVAVNNSTYDNAQFKVQQDTADKLIARFEHHNGSGNNYGLRIEHKGQAPDNNTSDFLVCGDTGAVRMIIYSDGDIQNHDNAYTAISDERLKEQIKDSDSQWNDIKAVKVKKFKFKSDVSDKGDSESLWRLGVVAQDLEAAGMNGLVKSEVLFQADDPDLKDNNVGDIKHYKSAKYSILYMKAIKALQEAMAKIETLETKVKALEDA